MYKKIRKNIIKVLVILVLSLIINTVVFNFQSLAADTKEITIKYLDENGNIIKQEEKKQIEMGNENETKYVSSYENIEGGTNIFPAKISGYVVQKAKIKTYYNGDYKEDGSPDEWAEYSLIDNDRIAITSPKSTDSYIVEFIYKADENVENTEQKENVESDKSSNILNNTNTNLNTDNNINNNETYNNTITNTSLPKTGRNNIISILVVISIINLIISIIKFNIYKNIK